MSTRRDLAVAHMHWSILVRQGSFILASASKAEGDGATRTSLDAVSAEDTVRGAGGGVGATLARVLPAPDALAGVSSEAEKAEPIADGEQRAEGAEVAAPAT